MPSWKKVITSGSNASLNSLYVANSITASAIYSSGSNQFGDATNDTQTLIGTTRISGSLAVTGSMYLPNLSYAVKNRIVVQDSTTGLLSYQSPADLTVFPYTGSAIVSGSLTTIGSQQVSGSLGVTGSVYIGSTATNNILITTAGGSSYFANDAITVQGPSFGPADAEIILHNNTTDVIGPRIDMARSYANNNLSAGNDLGELRFWRAYSNLSFTQGAYIKATAISGSTVASGPAALYFGTTASGSITPQQRVVIQENGNVGIGAPTASATLHVSGANIIFDIPSKANGYVLSSNASGNATWVQPATLAVFPYTGSALISGSLTVIGNTTLTGSLLVTQSYISKVDYIEFTSASDQPTAAARLGWNDSDGTLSLGLKGGNIDLLIGEAEFAYVYNAETSSLTKGTVVYISGSQGNRVAVKRAAASAEGGSAGTLGFVAEPITAGSTGFVIVNGVLKKVNTTGYTEGGLIYLSSSAGQYTQTKPIAPEHEVRLGYVERVNATVGSIYVKVDNGYELDELHDVRIISASSGNLIVRSGSLWINSNQLTGSYGLTGSLNATSITSSLQGTASWAVSASWAPGVSSTPGGSNTQIQYNSASAFAGTSSFTFNYVSESLQQGFSVIASGLYSHAEGATTKTGIQTAYSASISSGVITMSAVYGDNTGNFGADTKIYIYDSPFDNVYDAATLLVKQSYYSAPNTIVELYNNTSTTTKAYILSYANNNFGTNAGDQTIPGNYSHAEGEQAQAIGDYSHAEGFGIAVGKSSHAEGNSGLAIGGYSHAEGLSTQAIGYASHAEGVSTQAIGYTSHAEGYQTQAIGDYSHAEGAYTYAGYKGFNSNDIGSTNPGDIYLNSSYGNVSALFTAGNYIILSDSDDDNIYGTVKLQISGSSFDGTNTIISLIDTSIATSYASIGLFDIPEPAGANNLYIGYYSHAEGKGTQAIGYASHAEGNNIFAIGDYSHAEGINTQAIGKNSHAEGESTTAYAQASHAEGKQTYTGQYGYNSTDISSGVITLDSKYGDVKSSIEDGRSAQYIILDDRAYDNVYGIRQFSVSSVSSGTPTLINLNTSITTTQAIIYIPGLAQPLRADILLPGAYAHAEGSGSIASGTGSHATGYWTNAYREYSYAGGAGTIAVAPGQTVIGKYNNLDFNPGAYDYSLIVGKGTSTTDRKDILKVIPGDDTFYVSASNVQFAGLQDGSGLSQVVMYNPTNGAIAYTASSAIGGGGSPTTIKAGSGSAASFGGSPRTGSISFSSPFTNNLYAITVTGEDARTWTIQSKVSGSFVINSNSTVALTGPVYWIATPFNS